VGARSGIYSVSAGYVKISRYFFFALVVIGLLGAASGVFAQSQQTPQLTLTVSDVKTSVTGYHIDWVTISGTVFVSGPSQGTWTGGPIHFSGWAYIVGKNRFGGTLDTNITLSSGDFNPAQLNYPSLANSSFSAGQGGPHTVDSYVVIVDAYDQSGQLVGTSGSVQGIGGGLSGNLFILTMEIPLFQVPALGISAANPDFASLFSAFDQLPLGDFYMLLAEVAIIVLVGAGLINVILYLTGASEHQKGGTSGSLAGMSNIFVTLLMILLLPYAYNAVAGFVNVLDQQIIAGPGNPYSQYLANSQLIWNTLPTGGNILTDFIGAIASIMAWAMSWLLGSARIFLIGSVTVAMPIILVLRNIKFTARFAGVVEDTFFGLIFASVISALFVGLAAFILNHWSGSIFTAAGVDKTWVALAALMGAILAPTVFAPMTGFFFQTMSQVGMAATGTAFAIGAGAAGPMGAGITGGAAMAGQALGGLAANNPKAGVLQKAGAAIGGFGGGFSHSLIPMGQNMLLMGTVGTLGGLGASRSASAINRAIQLKMPQETSQNIVSYRAGALTTELQLPQDMKPHIERALGAKMDHNEIRRFDIQYHDDIPSFKSNLNGRVKDLMGRP
jgi:hypothetical protein